MKLTSQCQSCSTVCHGLIIQSAAAAAAAAAAAVTAMTFKSAHKEIREKSPGRRAGLCLARCFSSVEWIKTKAKRWIDRCIQKRTRPQRRIHRHSRDPTPFPFISSQKENVRIWASTTSQKEKEQRSADDVRSRCSLSLLFQKPNADPFPCLSFPLFGV